MKFKLVATAALAAAVLIVPAAVPASQPANVRLDALGTMTIAVAPADFRALLTDPGESTALSVELVEGYTTLEWINQDPFAL